MLHQGQGVQCGHCYGPGSPTRDQPSSLCLWAAQGTDELTGRLTCASILTPARPPCPTHYTESTASSSNPRAHTAPAIPCLHPAFCSSCRVTHPSQEMHTRSYVHLQTPASLCLEQGVVCPPAVNHTLLLLRFLKMYIQTFTMHYHFLRIVSKVPQSRQQHQVPIRLSSFPPVTSARPPAPPQPARVSPCLLSVSGACPALRPRIRKEWELPSVLDKNDLTLLELEPAGVTAMPVGVLERSHHLASVSRNSPGSV